jgi:hypothetical protein
MKLNPMEVAVQVNDLAEFETVLGKLCAGFEVPVTKARKDAYWTGFRQTPMTQFARLVDLALSGSAFISMPTVGALRKLIQEPASKSAAPIHTQRGPSLQEQLSEYVMLARFPAGEDSKFSPDQMRQTSLPWTYLYREWRDEKGHQSAECTGVLVPAAGKLPGFRVTVADMLGDPPLHDRVLRRQAAT